jgi:hypothetical protein
MKKREEAMYRAVLAKFQQHPKLREKLLGTGDLLIRDMSPQDNFWGVGRSGKGQNKLGRILMKIRAELQRGDAAAAAAVNKSPNAGIGVAQQQQQQQQQPVPAVMVPPSNNSNNGGVVIEKLGAEPVVPPTYTEAPAAIAAEVATAPLFPEPRQVQLGGPVLEIEDIPIEDIGAGEDTVKYPPPQPLVMEGGWSDDANVKVIKL